MSELSTRGTRLPAPVLGSMERAFGTSFETVQIHAESREAPRLGALALTAGEHVHFAPGQYQPHAHAGRELIGHELVHVVQQRAGLGTLGQRKASGEVPVDGAPALEAEADRLGSAAARGESVRVAGMPNPPPPTQSSATAIQRRVDPGAANGTRVTVRATNTPGVIIGTTDAGYRVGRVAGPADFTYDELDARAVAANVAQAVTVYANLAALPAAWRNHPQRLPNADRLPEYLRDVQKLVLQSPVARGDMHDIRALLALDPQFRVLICHHDERYDGDKDTIVGYYQGLANFTTRVAVIEERLTDVKEAVDGVGASSTTAILQWMQGQAVWEAGGAHRGGAQREQAKRAAAATFVTNLGVATAGVEHDGDLVDHFSDLYFHGFNRTDRYMLINYRVSGHEHGHRPPSHPELDTGAVGVWQMIEACYRKGFVPVPMVALPGGINWPGPSLIGYFNWPSCVANVRRNKRQAEYGLLRAFKRYNANIRYLGMRSGSTDAASFVGIPVIAPDVLDDEDAGLVGNSRASRRERFLPNIYRQLNLSVRDADNPGMAGWIGTFSADDMNRIRGTLDGGDAARIARTTMLGTALPRPADAAVDAPAQPSVAATITNHWPTLAAAVSDYEGELEAGLVALPRDDLRLLERITPYIQLQLELALALAAQAFSSRPALGEDEDEPAETTAARTAMTSAREQLDILSSARNTIKAAVAEQQRDVADYPAPRAVTAADFAALERIAGTLAETLAANRAAAEAEAAAAAELLAQQQQVQDGPAQDGPAQDGPAQDGPGEGEAAADEPAVDVAAAAPGRRRRRRRRGRGPRQPDE